MKIGVSACLLGHNVRYDGKNKMDPILIKLLEKHEVIPICPEVAAGFPIPRESLEIKERKVFTKSQKDVTALLLKGAKMTFEQIRDCDLLILKKKSPSCGHGQIYDGSFSGTVIEGNGIFTEMCLKEKITVMADDDPELYNLLA